MDPLTHGVIGLAISSFSGQAVSLDNPVSIGAALGAMSPDIDVISRLFLMTWFIVNTIEDFHIPCRHWWLYQVQSHLVLHSCFQV